MFHTALQICWKDSVLPYNLYALPWNSLTLWIFYAMLRFPENINLPNSICYCWWYRRLSTSWFFIFYQIVVLSALFYCDIHFIHSTTFRSKEHYYPHFYRRTLRHQAMIWQVSLTSSRRSQETSPSGLVFRIDDVPYPLHPTALPYRRGPLSYSRFSRKSFSVQHLPW